MYVCMHAQGFPIGFDILGKMAKNCMKITKPIFLGQNSVGTWRGDKPIFWLVGVVQPQSSPLWETLIILDIYVYI